MTERENNKAQKRQDQDQDGKTNLHVKQTNNVKEQRLTE